MILIVPEKPPQHMVMWLKTEAEQHTVRNFLLFFIYNFCKSEQAEPPQPDEWDLFMLRPGSWALSLESVRNPIGTPSRTLSCKPQKLTQPHSKTLEEGTFLPTRRRFWCWLAKKAQHMFMALEREWDGMGQGSPNGNEGRLLDAMRIHSGVMAILCVTWGRGKSRRTDTDAGLLGLCSVLWQAFACWWCVFVPWGLLSTTLRPLPESGQARSAE